MAVTVRLESRSLLPDAELAAFLRDRDGDGAVVSFVGVARGRAVDGAPVGRLVLDHYPGMTEDSIQRIAAAAQARFEVSDVAVAHRVGAVEPGEPIVFAAAASRHRRAAFEAVDYLMDRLKSDAAFWKREEGPDGARWIEPTDTDRAAMARWSD